MRTVRGVGAVACVVAAGIVLSACGGGSDRSEGKPGRTPSAAASTEESVTAEPEEPEPVYPPGPEGEIDEKADTEGWEYDSLYESASEFVQDICDSLPESAVDGVSRPQWLAEGGYLDGDGKAILKFGVPKLCPKWSKTLAQAVSGDYERWVLLGEYEVKARPGPYDPDSDVQEVGPGTYRAKGKFSGCYWERTSQSGEIIANQFVTQARVLTVTLRAGELFKNECGTFMPVG